MDMQQITLQQDFDHTIIELFEAQVRINPNFIALKDKTKKYTYLALNEKANQLAQSLKNKSVQPGDLVALLLEPSSELIIYLIAILKLGAIYIPLDTHAPKTRLKEILQDAQPKLIIVNEIFERQLSEIETQRYLARDLYLESKEYPKNNLDSFITPASSAYMMYTSGSTGRPKGVIIPHQAVVNVAFIENSIKIKARNRMAQFSNVAFDGSTYEIWTALLNGATLCIIPSDARFNHTKFKKILLEYGVTYLFLPTSYLHQLIKSAPDTLDTVNSILFGGEQINVTLIQQFIDYRKKLNRDIILINGYGPTETTAYVCRQIIDSRIDYDTTYLESIGQLITNTKGYVLDESLNEVSEGELYIAGVNLALGYHHCEQQNTEKFIANPFSNKTPYSRLYKTGDKVRILESGDLLYLGRYDDQVKIGGFRIHLNEIENALMHHPKVSMAAINVEIGGGSHKTLTAYIVFTDNEVVGADEIRNYLKQNLPAYMLPAKYVKVDKLPLTLIGKVDKTKLEKISHMDLSLHIDSSNESSIEEKIKVIWQHLLNRTFIDTNKNLFELGANSLLIADACSRINKELNSELHIGDILAHPTIHKLSRYLEGDIDLITIKKRRKAYPSDIAIVGMSCRFPGANGIDEYWELLSEGRESLSRFNKNDLNSNDANHVPVRGILEDIEQFDGQFFGFTAVEASLADPQQRELIECSWHALEHACIAPNKESNKIISVFAGMSDSTYLQENILKNTSVSAEYDVLHQRIATSTSMLSTQISYRLNLKGRSVNVNTACSTGLIAVDQACQDLISGYSDIALAGAASIVVPQQQGYLYQPGSIVSSDGHCRPFSEEANGTVFSNGVGVVVLKRLSDAIKDNNTIYAVIKGRGINNDGAEKLGFTAPSTHGQMVCIRNALEDAQISADEITYLEAHGTATALGDIVEIDALKSVFKEHTENKQFCALGSVKANIGHTDVVAGIAGLIKTALCLYHHKIPPLIHFNNPNPDLDLFNSPFFVNKTLLNWDVGFKKRYAGISSFGVGGTNAHMILSEHDNVSTLTNMQEKDELLIVSAKTQQALEQYTNNIANALSGHESNAPNLQSIAYSLQTGREDFSWRTFSVGTNKNDLIKEFQKRKAFFLDGTVHSSIIFMFPGQGSQYTKMAKELYDSIPEFAAYLDRGSSIAESYLNRDLLEVLCDPNHKEINLTQYAQPILFIIEYALAQILISYGIKPEALIGHSLGEYVAACLAEVFSFEEGVALICKRAILMASAPKGAMIAIECTDDELTHLKELSDAEVALHNSPYDYVLSGDFESIKIIENYLLRIKKPYQKLKVSHAFHSRLMEPLKESFIELFDSLTLSAPSIPVISNVTGDWLLSEKAMDAHYWYDHLRQTVKLNDGFKTLLKDKHPFFIEIGPGQSLGTLLKRLTLSCKLNNQAQVTHTLPNHNKETGDLRQLLTAVGLLWQQGVAIHWEKLHGNNSPVKIALPLYPFQKQKYWIEPNLVTDASGSKLYNQVWSRKPFSYEYHFINQHIQNHSWIIFKEQSEISKILISILQHYEANLIIIELGQHYESSYSNHFKIDAGNKEDYIKCMKMIKDDLRNPCFMHLFSLTKLENDVFQPESVNSILNLGFYSILYLTQAFIEVMGEELSLKGLIVTTGTQKITGMETDIPVNACIHGACQVISKEYPSFEIRSIDIDTTAPLSQKSMAFLINYLIEPWEKYYTAMALRHNTSWELNYHPVSSHQENELFKKGGVYLITGGLGGISLTLCDVIILQSQNPHLILISKSPSINEEDWDSIIQDPQNPRYQQILSLIKLKKAGASIYWHQIDITEAEPISSLVAFYQQKLGQINGLIHSAGIAGGGVIALKTKANADQILMPKIQGTYNLARAFKNIHLDFVVLMSSIVALLGEPGQIDYAAANSGLSAFATADLFDSNASISISWNTWKDTGMAVNRKTPQDITFLNRGNDISSEQGKDIFLKALKSGYSHIIVSNYKLEQHDFMIKQHQQNIMAPTTKTSREMLTISNDYTAPQNSTEEQLVNLWQNILGIESVGVEDDFFDIGGHSLNALQVIDKTNKLFKKALSIQHLYKYPTVRELSVLLNETNTKQMDIIVPLRDLKNKPPHLFVCHPASGMIYCFNPMTSQISHPISIFGIQDPSITEGKILFSTVDDMAKEYLTAIKKIQPQGPYYLMGYSFGGTIVYEIAHLLSQNSEKVSLLALIDSWSVFSTQHQDKDRFIKQYKETHENLSDALISLAWSRMQLLLNHTPTSMNHDMYLFKASELLNEYKSIDHPSNGWSEYNHGTIFCHQIKANHETILNNENSFYILDILNKKGLLGT